MKELLAALNQDFALAVFAPALLLSILFALYRLRESGMRLSTRKQKELLFLLDEYRWCKQPAIRMQLAVKQAFGRTLDEREFDFILTRHNPLTLLFSRRSAERWVRFSEHQYHDARAKWLRWIPLTFASNCAMFAGVVLGTACAALAIVLLDRSHESKYFVAGALLLAYGGIVFVYSAWVSARAYASYRLISLLESEHPTNPAAHERISSQLRTLPTITPSSSVSAAPAKPQRPRRKSRAEPSGRE